MSHHVIADMRQAVVQFKRDLPSHIVVPDYALQEIINCAFDALIFSDDLYFTNPDWSRLHNFHRDYLENKPNNQQDFDLAYSGLVRSVRGHMESHGFMGSGDFAYIPKALKTSSVLLEEIDPPTQYLEPQNHGSNEDRRNV